MPFLVSEQCIEGRQRTSRSPYDFGKLCAFEALFEKKLFRRIENSEAPAVEAIFGPASGLRPVVPVDRKSVVEGRSVSVRGGLGGRGHITKKKNYSYRTSEAV